MTIELKSLPLLLEAKTSNEEEYQSPIDISEIISICQEYAKLGYQIQQQVENILEIGVQEAISNGSVKQETLPFIKVFLHSIANNVYLGDACIQADDCIELICQYEMKNKITYGSKFNN